MVNAIISIELGSSDTNEIRSLRLNFFSKVENTFSSVLQRLMVNNRKDFLIHRGTFDNFIEAYHYYNLDLSGNFIIFRTILQKT